MAAARELPAGWDERRAFECRLVPERWLETFEDASTFLAERQLLSITPSTSVPSVFGACAPNPDPLARGYAAWPPDKWWWPGALSELPEVRRSRLLGGRVLLLAVDLFAAVSPLGARELALADDGAFGADAQQLVRYLDANGPSVLGEVRKALGMPPRTMADLRDRLERVAAVISDDISMPARNGGHVHTSRLFRVDQIVENISPADAAGAHRRLLLAAARAAVIAPRKEVERWFAWPAAEVLDRLIDEGVLQRVGGAWLAA